MLNGTEVSKGIGIGIAKVLKTVPGESDVSLDVFSAALKEMKPGSVLVASHLAPYMVGRLKDHNVAGLVSETGGMTSHSALVAKSMGIPAVYGVDGATLEIKDGDTIVVDGIYGNVYINPDVKHVAEFSERKKLFLKDREDLEKYRGMKTVMADGTTPRIFCNVSDIVGVMQAIDNGGEGIGLFRTENLFAEFSTPPSEEEQTKIYTRVVTAMDGRDVVIRTLDIGGDKSLPYLDLEVESNPFLGYRAVRYSLGNRDFFKTQLRAILRASALGNISVMIPMVTCVEEMRQVKALIYEIKTDLRDEGYEFDDSLKVGAMIETPSAAVISDILAKECDFFSIGTNDLVAYTMSADRGNRRVAYLQSIMQPSVLRLIKKTIDSAGAAGIPVSICGEAGADPLSIPMFVGLGCDKFSVNPLSVPEVRRTLSEWSVEEAKAAAEKIMNLSVESEIREFVHKNSKGIFMP